MKLIDTPIESKVSSVNQHLYQLDNSVRLIILTIDGNYNTKSLNLTEDLGITVADVQEHIKNRLIEHKEFLETVK